MRILVNDSYQAQLSQSMPRPESTILSLGVLSLMLRSTIVDLANEYGSYGNVEKYDRRGLDRLYLSARGSQVTSN